MKPLNSGYLRVLKNLYVIERCPLLESSLKKIVTFGTKRFVRYSMSAVADVRYWEVSLYKEGRTVQSFRKQLSSISIYQAIFLIL